jgi:hypothetical protein
MRVGRCAASDPLDDRRRMRHAHGTPKPAPALVLERTSRAEQATAGRWRTDVPQRRIAEATSAWLGRPRGRSVRGWESYSKGQFV